MPVLSLNIPNFISGVSQQTDTLRFPSQAEESINAYPSIVEGLAKRPPTRHIQTLQASSTAGDFNFGSTNNFNFHLIDRGENERFFVALANNGINVYDLNGARKTIYVPGSNAGKTTEFLTSTNPRNDFKLLTIADYTFILKKTLKPRMSNLFSNPALSLFTPITNTPGASQKTSLFFVKQGSYDNEYVAMFRVPTGAYNVAGGAVTWKWVRYVVQTLHPYDNTTSTFTDLNPDIKVFGYEATETAAGVAGAWTALNSGNPITSQNAQESLTSTLRITTLFTTAVTHATFGVNAVAPSYLFSAGQTNTGANPTNRFIFGDSQTGNTWGFWATHTILNFPYTASVSDSASGTLMGLAFDEVQAFSDLPNAGPDGMLVKVVGYPQDTSDDYWLKFSASSGVQNKGNWKESMAPGLFTDIDWQYMPYILVKLSSGDFALTPLDGVTRTYGSVSYTAPSWGKRKYGDDETNELPSFINRMDMEKLKAGTTTYATESARIDSATDAITINDIFFYKNRLGFLAGENVIFSESGEYFNFFRTTITQLLDDNPIDVGVSATSVNKLNYAIPFFDRLILFSEQNQFTLTSSDNLTPKSVSIQLSTSFSVQTNVQPLPVGKNIYFPYSKQSFSGMREYFVNPANSFMDSADISLAIPAYIEGNVVALTGTDTENIIFALTDKYLNGMYVYKYLINGDEKIQSAWCKFQFSPSSVVIGVLPLKEVVYLFIKRGTSVFLESMDLQSYKKQDFLSYQPYLDRFCSTSSGATMTYNGTTNQTEITLPYQKANDEIPVAVSSEFISSDYSAGFVPNDEKPVYLRIAPPETFSESEISAFNSTLHPTGSFSIAIWVKVNSLSSDQCIFYKQTSSSPGWKEWYLDIYNGNLRFFVGDSYNFGYVVSKAVPASLTSWTLITCIYNSSTNQLQIKTSDNGTTTTASSVPLNGAGTLQIPSNFDLDGKLGGFGIWSKVLSAGDITELEKGEKYLEFSASLKTSLNGWWELDESGSSPKIESQNKLINFNIVSGTTQENDSYRKNTYNSINTFPATDVVPIVGWEQTGANNLKVFINGNRTAATIYLGILYTTEHTMSRISLRSPGSKGGQMVVNTGLFTLRYGNLNFNNTKEFKILVYSNTSDKGQLFTYNKKFTTPRSGIYKFPILLKASEAKIKFVNESPYPSAFMSMDIEGFYATQSRKAS